MQWFPGCMISSWNHSSFSTRCLNQHFGSVETHTFRFLAALNVPTRACNIVGRGTTNNLPMSALRWSCKAQRMNLAQAYLKATMQCPLCVGIKLWRSIPALVIVILRCFCQIHQILCTVSELHLFFTVKHAYKIPSLYEVMISIAWILALMPLSAQTVPPTLTHYALQSFKILMWNGTQSTCCKCENAPKRR